MRQTTIFSMVLLSILAGTAARADSPGRMLGTAPFFRLARIWAALVSASAFAARYERGR